MTMANLVGRIGTVHPLVLYGRQRVIAAVDLNRAKPSQAKPKHGQVIVTFTNASQEYIYNQTYQVFRNVNPSRSVVAGVRGPDYYKRSRAYNQTAYIKQQSAANSRRVGGGGKNK